MLYDRVRVATATVGAGPVTPGAPLAGFNALPVGAATGTVLSYALEDAGNAFEVGAAVWNAATGSFERRPTSSSNGGAPINLSGAATLSIVVRADDFSLDSYVSGRWYVSERAGSISSPNGALTGSVYLVPIFLHEPLYVDGLRTRITTAASGGRVMQGLYANNPATFAPTGLPLFASGDLSTTVVAELITTPATPVFAQRIVWGAVQSDASALRLHYLAPTDLGFAKSRGSATSANISNTAGGASSVQGFTFANTYGALPDLTGATLSELVGGSAPIPLFAFRKA